MNKSSFHVLAESIVRLGFRVVPHGTVEPSRHPLVKDWPNVATRNLAQIKLWARDFLFHKPSVGIVAGDESIWAIDADEPERLGKKLPRTTTVLSGGGGKHLYFKHDRYSRSKLVPLGNVWVRGSKRDKAVELFVKPHALLAPGTVHHKTGVVYGWIHEMKPVAAPRKFVDAVAALPWNRSAVTTGSKKESGYWSSEALSDCLTALAVEYDAGRRDSQYRVPCPWNADHGKPSDSLSDKTTVFLRDGWPCFSCFSSACQTPKKTWRDFITFYDPLRERFSIDSWLSEEAARIRKEFRHER